MAFTSTYFPLVYQITTPLQVPLIIINITYYLKLILEAVVANDTYVARKRIWSIQILLPINKIWILCHIRKSVPQITVAGAFFSPT